MGIPQGEKVTWADDATSRSKSPEPNPHRPASQAKKNRGQPGDPHSGGGWLRGGGGTGGNPHRMSVAKVAALASSPYKAAQLRKGAGAKTASAADRLRIWSDLYFSRNPSSGGGEAPSSRPASRPGTDQLSSKNHTV
eukprot:CAMPEP_0118954580 /NCGR_PEP_ID=MMETSP1169-20130426/58494_1 /TAXON_ID=36882 /ORGANISM="Pyramimonas obovata, Strain CCMP722" /LENGTH=136 /DNA_ID=CAMNT_0006902237 /DNA_START=279 /DNA_END=686 /DNA_ORIENTATION=+